MALREEDLDPDYDYRRDQVLAVNDWPSNAELIADVAKLGYLQPDLTTLDPTYGLGVWWKLWQPGPFVMHTRNLDGSDFRHLPYADESFQQIAFDPPYCAKGGRATSGMKDMDERFGQDDCPATPKLLQELINDGLTEMNRLLQPRHRGRGGIVIVKCMNYVSSGHVWWGVDEMKAHAVSLGLTKLDQFDHFSVPKPQPPRKRKDGKPVVQQHAAHNSSTLLVFLKKR